MSGHSAQIMSFTLDQSVNISGTQVSTYDNGENDSCLFYSQDCCQYQMIKYT